MITPELLRAARDMLPNPDTSITAIAKLLGVSPGTLYNHIPDLSELRASRNHPTAADPAALDSAVLGSGLGDRPDRLTAVLADLPQDRRPPPSVAAYDDLLHATPPPARRTTPTGPAGPAGGAVPPPAPAPAQDDQEQDDQEQDQRSAAAGRRSKAQLAWQQLNERQRTYLAAIYDADQAAERTNTQVRARGERTPPADVWRWLPYAVGTLIGTDHTALQQRLRHHGVLDAGAGATLEALRARGLILIRHGIIALASPTVEVRLATAGRAAARAGLGVTAPARTPKGLLSHGLYRQLLDVAAAEPDGLEHLRGENHLHIGTDYTSRGHPSRGYVDYLNTTPGQGRWHLTDTGRRHLTEHHDTYQQLYTDLADQADPPTIPDGS